MSCALAFVAQFFKPISQQSRPLFWDDCVLPMIQLACRSRILTPNITLKANGILWCLNIKKDSLCLWGQHQISGDYSPWQFFEDIKSLTQILSIGCQTRRIPGVVWMWSPTSDHGRPWSPASPHQSLRLPFSLPSRWGCWLWFEKALSKDGQINRMNSKLWEKTVKWWFSLIFEYLSYYFHMQDCCAKCIKWTPGTPMSHSEKVLGCDSRIPVFSCESHHVCMSGSLCQQWWDSSAIYS